MLMGNMNPVNVNAGSEEHMNIYFQTCEVTEEQQSYFEENIHGLAQSIAISLNVTSERLSIGRFYPVRGVDGMYYIPVFGDNECVCVVTYVYQDDIGLLSFSEDMADCINNLECGTYYFEKMNNSIFIVGTSTLYEVESLEFNENDELPVYYLEEDSCVTNIWEGLRDIEINARVRAVSSRSLDVPFYANGGTYGYCWLSCSAAIIDYYGYATSPLSNLHSYVHTGHSLDDCPGGTILDARNVICCYAAKYGMAVDIRITPGTVQTQINAGKPVYSVWSYYNNNGVRESGHAMVIVGYTYVDNTGSFTYKIMDPNKSEYVFIYSNSTASEVTYVISGKTYVWDSTLYNFSNM